MVEKEKIGISGSRGFIGSHLAERFNSEQLERLGRDGVIPLGVDVIFDLAAYGNMAGHTGGHKEIYQANLMRVIDELSQLNEQKYIYISTSSVILPVQTAYSLSKMAAEKYIQTFGKNVAIVRPFTITGVGDQKEHLIPKLIDSCLNGTEMPFVPEPVHDFLDVEDFVDALLVIKNKGQFKGEVYEAGWGVEARNEDVKEIVEDVTGKKANVKYVESMRSYDTKEWKADNKSLVDLGWFPRKMITDTIFEMVEYARKNTENK